MKTLIYALIIITLCFLLLGGASISLNPFKIEFKRIYYAIGFTMILIGITFVEYQTKKDTQRQVLDEVIKIVDDMQLKKQNHENNN